MSHPAPHAVARLRAERLARSLKPFVARGSRAERCPHCRVQPDYCLCAWRPQVQANAAMCLVMHDIEALKPSNTGWLIADVVPETHKEDPTGIGDAFRAGFPAILSTHEHRMLRFQPDEFGEVMRGILARLKEDGLSPVLATDVEVKDYLESYSDATVETVDSTGSKLQVKTEEPATGDVTFTIHRDNEMQHVTLGEGESYLLVDALNR